MNWHEPLTDREFVWGRIMALTGFIFGCTFTVGVMELAKAVS